MWHESGAKKCKRNKRQQALTESQRGAMDKFIRKETQVSSDNQSVDPSTLALDIIAYNDTTDDQTWIENNVEVEEDHVDVNLNSSPVPDIDDSLHPKRMMLFK
jgi:hypothetical protein